jgi:PilZ domain
MSDPKPSKPAGTDWTHFLSDPELVGHLGELLRTYREAPPEKRDQALMEAMRNIKGHATTRVPETTECTSSVPPTLAAISSPPFEPDIFTPSWGDDRRRYPRMKCFVAVELRVGGAAPIWGNLSNTSIGGCLVETAAPVPSGASVEIGLWVASGKIWVKGMILNGTVTKSSPSFGVRIRFGQLEPSERESLREFLKFVESTNKGYSSQHGYLAQLKR